jgi:hypothetical protein
MAKLRAHKRDVGLVSFDVPSSIVAEVKAAGSWDAWQRATREAAVHDALARWGKTWGMKPERLQAWIDHPPAWRRWLSWWLL